MADEKTVKCADCGLLALRKAGPGGVADHPMGEEVRRRGEHRSYDFETPPHCHVAAFNLPEEYKAEMKKTDGEKVRSFLNVINVPRECAKFCVWDQAKTPKEHADMQRADEFARIQAESHKTDADRAERQLEKQADRQDARERASREWQENESGKNRQWQEVESDKSRGWQEKESTKNRDWQGTEADKNRAWQEKQTAKQRKWELIRWLVSGVIAALFGTATSFTLEWYKSDLTKTKPTEQQQPPPSGHQPQSAPSTNK